MRIVLRTPRSEDLSHGHGGGGRRNHRRTLDLDDGVSLPVEAAHLVGMDGAVAEAALRAGSGLHADGAGDVLGARAELERAEVGDDAAAVEADPAHGDVLADQDEPLERAA